MDKLTILTYLINFYYNVCDNWKDYTNEQKSNGGEVIKHRASIIDTIFIISYDRVPKVGETFKVFNLLNNDLKCERFSAEQIIDKLNITK